ncbi:MAG: hypothetical protein ACYDDF_03225 [Thermoplasmatota archaeon]
MRVPLALAVCVGSVLAIVAGVAITPGSALSLALGPPASSSSDAPAPATSEVTLHIQSLPLGGGSVQDTIVPLVATQVITNVSVKWVSADAASSNGYGYVIASADPVPLTGFGAGWGSGAGLHAGNVSLSCCEGAPFTDVPGPSTTSSGSRSSGMLSISPSHPLVLTLYATSWGRGSELNLTVEASAPVLTVHYGSAHRGGVYVDDLFSDGHASGTYLTIGSEGVGSQGDGTLSMPFRAGYALTCFVGAQGQETSLKWTLPNGTTGAHSHENMTFLTAIGTTAGRFSLDAATSGNNPQGLGLFAPPTPARFAVVIAADVDPMANLTHAVPP